MSFGARTSQTNISSTTPRGQDFRPERGRTGVTCPRVKKKSAFNPMGTLKRVPLLSRSQPAPTTRLFTISVCLGEFVRSLGARPLGGIPQDLVKSDKICRWSSRGTIPIVDHGAQGPFAPTCASRPHLPTFPKCHVLHWGPITLLKCPVSSRDCRVHLISYRPLRQFIGIIPRELPPPAAA